MFENIKRASYISQNNFQHWSTQDGIQMHLWLQSNGWPANEFIDWFMRTHPKSDYSSKISFELYLTSQYDWVSSDKVESLNWLYEKINTPEFQSHDKDKLTAFLKPMVVGANSRPEPISWINPEDYDLFGYDLMNLLDRIFNDVHNGLFNKSAKTLITYEDFEAFGHDLIATIIKITLQTIFQNQSNNKFINKAIEKSTNNDIETFGEDLIDLIWRSVLQNIESKKST